MELFGYKFTVSKISKPKKSRNQKGNKVSEKISDQILRIICEQNGLDEEEVKLHYTVEHLGLDSLDVIETVMALEEDFDIEIEEGHMDYRMTVADVILRVNNEIEKEKRL